ncbi:MAG: TIGR02587 family membrane protein [Pseudomonadota bacterium]
MRGDVTGNADLYYLQGLARGLAGALLFALPLLMTMEMWWLGGFTMDRLRLLIFLVMSLPMLLGISYYVGFEPTFDLVDEVLDALAAFAIGFLLSAAALALMGVLTASGSPTEMIGQVALCAVPAAIGALLAGKQFSTRGIEQQDRDARGFWRALFLMAVGAVFLAFNVAPTEEMVLISHLMGLGHALALMAISLLALHMLVYALGFPGEERRREAGGSWLTFATYTLPGYAVALGISLFCLWIFGRLDGVALHEQASMMVVLGFPASLGAATARLVV